MLPLALGLCRLSLFAYPRRFRRHFGAEMVAVTAARLEAALESGRVRLVAATLWCCVDALTSGIAERLWLARRRVVTTPYPPARHSRSETMSAESIAMDVRLALRRFRQAPVFALATILTLGLGIGATTAIFSVVNAVLLRPLPYANPDRLVAVWSNNTRQHEPRNPVSPANFAAIREEATTLAGVEAMYSFLVNSQMDVDGVKEMLVAATVSPGMFDLIGRSALHGRTLGAGDESSLVLSHSLWTRKFGADPQVIGRSVRLSGMSVPVTIVGVMPADFVFPYRSMLGPVGSSRALSPDLWVELPMTSGRMVDAAGQPNRSIHMLAVLGRLAEGATVAAARTELEAIAARRAAIYPDTNDGWQASVLPLDEQAVGQVRPVMVLLAVGVAVLLLMTCLNVANVLLARATARQRDLAVRAALGATDARLVQQSLVESGVLALFGGLAGAVVVWLGTPAVVALAPADLPRLHETRFDGVVFAFALVASAVAGLVVGVLPAVASRRGRPDALADTHRATSSVSNRRTRAGLVVAEIALATVLAVGAGLLVRSFLAVARVNPGFESSRLLTFQQFVPEGARTPAAQVAFLDELMTRLSSLPGATAVGGSTRIPLGSTQVTTHLTIEGRDVPMAAAPEVDMRRAVGRYFQAMGMPVLRGRVFEDSDRSSEIGLAVVNSALAARVFPGEDPLRRRVRMGPNPSAPWLTIIGVVGDIRHSSLEHDPRPEIYISYLQAPPVSPFMVVRTTGDPLALASGVREAAKSLGADPPFNVSTMDGLRAESMALRRFTVLLAALFGILALVLAVVGIYGVTALVVAERTDEVGVRIALGATPVAILSMILGQAAKLGVIGLSIGTAAGLALAQLARSLLFGIEPIDPLTFFVVPAVLLSVALLAAFVPARRAMRISPVEAIRA